MAAGANPQQTAGSRQNTCSTLLSYPTSPHKAHILALPSHTLALRASQGTERDRQICTRTHTQIEKQEKNRETQRQSRHRDTERQRQKKRDREGNGDRDRERDRDTQRET